ncbi:MAG: zf-HC2 domain-containing protein [Terriglobales bacterium]
MVCEAWREKLDTYLDGELPEQEMRTFDAHVRGCPSCAAAALTRVQMKRAVQAAGKRFTPSADFRKRIERSVARKPQSSFGWGWMAVAATAILVAGALTLTYVQTGSRREAAYRDHIFTEIADLHVATLASASPVDVISTDRHTVKPWFQGKIPFAFNLPELQNSPFTLLGGRVAYLDQTPGAHLIYDVRKHHISVFIFPERSLLLSSKLSASTLDENNASPKQTPFNMETWSQGGLRYFVIGDASASDIDGLAKLFKAAS